MEKKPFKDINIRDIFRDIDGTILIKTDKTYAGASRSEVMNCVVLVPNKPNDYRGQMKKKENDSYCEVLDDVDMSDIRLKENHDISPETEQDS